MRSRTVEILQSRNLFNNSNSVIFRNFQISMKSPLVQRYWYIFQFISIWLQHIIMVSILAESGDIETTPGPKKTSCIKFFHLNVIGLAANDFVKLSLIDAFITTHLFYLICLSETFFY